MDIKAFYKLTYGLYIISSKTAGGKDSACVANTLAQVTSSPERLSITLNKNSFTAKAIESSQVFCGTVLLQDVPMNTIAGFGFRSSADADKFEGLETAIDDNGVKYLVRDMAARFSCKVINSLDLGTHIMFVGELTDSQTMEPGAVLTYEYYQTVKKGTTPKGAPSFKEVAAKTGYRCSVCGYVYEGDTLPGDFVCPICKKGVEAFEKI